TAFIESTLAQVYKVKDGDTFRGGPAYYMRKALGFRKLGIVFAILLTLCFGFIFNAVQSNTISQSFMDVFGLPDWIIGDRKSTRLNSSHVSISYAVFCLKKK